MKDPLDLGCDLSAACVCMDCIEGRPLSDYPDALDEMEPPFEDEDDPLGMDVWAP